jgi:murein DD-endopeptidase MepM/ murein hydrolase activator NlpD
LQRIDARLRARTERDLISKGLLGAKPGERSDGRVRGKTSFVWPLTGRISAGFYDEGYKRYFGVAHKGIDIVTRQGTPVFASSDGIVFLARYGGATGYSYVLLGHTNGYATLYGHLSAINITTGQLVSAGQQLGSSGGTPGTNGAGPMTTGAHLHFEVIQEGRHVNPLSVL